MDYSNNSANFLSDFADGSLPATGGGTGALNGVDGMADLSSAMFCVVLLGSGIASESCEQHCSKGYNHIETTIPHQMSWSTQFTRQKYNNKKNNKWDPTHKKIILD